MTILDRSFPLDHAGAKGHFPGNPIIPGAVLLSEVLLAIETDLGRSLENCEVKSAKFIRPVRPGDRVSIEYSGHGEDTIRFSCSAGGKAVLTGTYGVPPFPVCESSDERDS